MRFKAKIIKCKTGKEEEPDDNYQVFDFSKKQILFTERQSSGTYWLDSAFQYSFFDESPYLISKEFDSHKEKDRWSVQFTSGSSFIEMNLWNTFKMKWIHKKWWIQKEATMDKMYGGLIGIIVTFLVGLITGFFSIGKKDKQDSLIAQVITIDTIHKPLTLTKDQQLLLDSIEWNRKLDSAKAINPYHIPDEYINNLDLRLSFRSQEGDLGYLQAMIIKNKKFGNTYNPVDSSNIIAYDVPIYLPIGTYKIDVKTREYKSAYYEVVVNEQNINSKISANLFLIKK